MTCDNVWTVARGTHNVNDVWVAGAPPASVRTAVDRSQAPPPLERTSADPLAKTQDDPDPTAAGTETVLRRSANWR